MKIQMILAALLISVSALSAPQAHYYRVWQGFMKSDLSMTYDSFLSQLPGFMNKTLDLYQDHLNNYLVAVSPQHKPDFIPDEFALVALESEDSYKTIRATPEGKAYGDSHWEIFNKENSASVTYTSQIPAILESNKSYDLISKPVDWKSGYTVFFIGVRKESITVNDFLTKLSTHIRDVSQSLASQGLLGYIVIANENYEVAYMNWKSKSAMEQAFVTNSGQRVQAQAEEIMTTVQYSTSEKFNGKSVEAGHFYKTK